jgi:hypothetical protein
VKNHDAEIDGSDPAPGAGSPMSMVTSMVKAWLDAVNAEGVEEYTYYILYKPDSRH